MYMPNYRIITSINEKDLYMLNIVQHFIDRMIRRNDPDINYNIKYIEYEREGTSAGAIVNIPDNGITLHYKLTKTSNSDDYIIDNIEVEDYFTDIDNLEDAFLHAIEFVKDYINNTNTSEQECEILRFSFDTGEFLVDIIDLNHPKPVKRVFKFKVEYGNTGEIVYNDDVVGVKYLGEVRSEFVDINL